MNFAPALAYLRTVLRDPLAIDPAPGSAAGSIGRVEAAKAGIAGLLGLALPYAPSALAWAVAHVEVLVPPAYAPLAASALAALAQLYRLYHQGEAAPAIVPAPAPAPAAVVARAAAPATVLPANYDPAGPTTTQA